VSVQNRGVARRDASAERRDAENPCPDLSKVVCLWLSDE
jgi:hypothetical protein